MPSAPARTTRAIMFTDIKGYSRLMGEDETLALALLEEHNSLLLPLIEEHRGEVIKFIGDAILASFASATDAVRSAVAIQERLRARNREDASAPPILVRIGIHLGDVVLRDGDAFGDGVNIAARLEPLAPPGGVVVSQTIRDLIRAQSEFDLVSIGEHQLKNIPAPMELFQVRIESTDEILSAAARKTRTSPSLRTSSRLALLAGLGAAVGIVTFTVSGWPSGLTDEPRPARQWKLQRFTPALGVPAAGGASLSPDGKTVIYRTDSEKVSWWTASIPGGRRESLPLPEGLKVGAISILEDGRLFYFGEEETTGATEIRVGELGEAAHKKAVVQGPSSSDLRDVCPSPDGSRLAFIRESELAIYEWGQELTRIGLYELTHDIPTACSWNPDGKSIAFTFVSRRVPAFLEVLAADGSSRKRLLSDRCLNQLGVGTVVWWNERHLLYACQSDNKTGGDSRVFRIDTLEPENREVIAEIPAPGIQALGISADRSRIFVGTFSIEHTLDVATLDSEHREVTSISTIARDRSWSVPFGQHPDGGLLFRTGDELRWARPGSTEADEPEVLATLPSALETPALAGDHVLYFSHKKGSEEVTLVSLPLESSAPSKLSAYSTEEIFWVVVRCSTIEPIRCVVGGKTADPDVSNVLAWIDPTEGTISEPFFRDRLLAPVMGIALSPSGETVAIVDHGTSILFVDTGTGESTTVQIDLAHVLQYLGWSADGEEVHVSAMRLKDNYYGLLAADQSGHQRVLLGREDGHISHPVALGDDRIAFQTLHSRSEFFALEPDENR